MSAFAGFACHSSGHGTGSANSNATTRKALRDAEAGRGMTDYASVDEMFTDLDI